MAEWRLFEAGTVPECATADWYLTREHAPHLEQQAHRPRLLAAAALVLTALEAGATSVCDLGCGDGGLLSLLPKEESVWGYDLSPANVAAARARGLDVQLRDFITENVVMGDCTILTETLEHLVDPHGMLERIAKHARWIVVSSPRNETAEHHYEFHLWAWDAVGYAAMLERTGWTILQHDMIGDFQVLLCERD